MIKRIEKFIELTLWFAVVTGINKSVCNTSMNSLNDIDVCNSKNQYI